MRQNPSRGPGSCPLPCHHRHNPNGWLGGQRWAFLHSSSSPRSDLKSSVLGLSAGGGGGDRLGSYLAAMLEGGGANMGRLAGGRST
jgi:hypothetical protein